MRAHLLVSVNIRTERAVAREIRRIVGEAGGSLEKIDIVFGDVDILFTVNVLDDTALASVVTELHKDPEVTRTVVYVAAGIDLEAEEAIVAGNPA